MSLSSPGIGSGLDVKSIVTQLVALERKPIEQLQAQASTIQTKLSSFGLLQSYTANIRDIADRLSKPEFWAATGATTSDNASVSVSSTTTASAGSYAVEVTKLAQMQSIASKAYVDKSSVVGTGSLRIELGAWDTGQTAFTPDGSKTALDITIGAADNTLDKIKAKINAANAGVTASIVNDADGAKLVLRSSTTGAMSAVRITATDDDADNTDALGLSALAFNPAAAPGQMRQTQAAANATATINGLAVSSPTNTLANVIDGVTLTLNKTTTAAVDVKVALDSGSLKKAVADFAKAYSDINVYITAQTKYDAVTKKAASLQGDRPTLALQSSLRGVFLDNSGASSAFARLSEVGMELQTDGSIKVNDAKLTAALAKPTELAKLFTSTASSDSAEHGFAVRVKAMAAQLIGSDGAITSRTKGLRDSVTRNQTQQQRLEDRVALTKARMTKQYAALDVVLSKVNGIGGALTQSLTALAAQSIAINK